MSFTFRTDCSDEGLAIQTKKAGLRQNPPIEGILATLFTSTGEGNLKDARKLLRRNKSTSPLGGQIRVTITLVLAILGVPSQLDGVMVDMSATGQVVEKADFLVSRSASTSPLKSIGTTTPLFETPEVGCASNRGCISRCDSYCSTVTYGMCNRYCCRSPCVDCTMGQHHADFPSLHGITISSPTTTHTYDSNRRWFKPGTAIQRILTPTRYSKRHISKTRLRPVRTFPSASSVDRLEDNLHLRFAGSPGQNWGFKNWPPGLQEANCIFNAPCQIARTPQLLLRDHDAAQDHLVSRHRSTGSDPLADKYKVD